MTVASYERDPAKPGGCLFPVVPEIIASTTPATTTPTRPETPPTPRNPRSSNPPEKVLDIPTSFIMWVIGRSISTPICRADWMLRGERSALFFGAPWVEEFECTFADLPRSITFVLDVAACGGDVVVPDEPGHVFEIE